MKFLRVFIIFLATDTVTRTLSSTSTASTSTQPKSRSMDIESFVVRTSVANKKKFDLQIAKFIYEPQTRPSDMWNIQNS